MNKHRLSFADLLSAVVFLPASSILVYDLIHKVLKLVFRMIGKVMAVILL